MKGTTTQDRLWTGSFLRICLVNLFIFVNFHALLPTFPFFVTYLGTVQHRFHRIATVRGMAHPHAGTIRDIGTGTYRHDTHPDGLFRIGRHRDGRYTAHGARRVPCSFEQCLFHLGDGHHPAQTHGRRIGNVRTFDGHIHRRSSCIRAGGNERLGIPTVVRHRCADGFGGPADRHGDSVPQLRGIRRPAAHSGAVRADVPACRRHAVLFHDGVWRSGGICGDLRHLLPLARRRNLLYLHRTGHRSHAYSAGACRRSVRRSEAGLHRQCSHRDRYSAAGVRAQRTVLPVVGSSAGLQFRRHPAPPYRRWRCTP